MSEDVQVSCAVIMDQRNMIVPPRRIITHENATLEELTHRLKGAHPGVLTKHNPSSFRLFTAKVDKEWLTLDAINRIQFTTNGLSYEEKSLDPLPWPSTTIRMIGLSATQSSDDVTVHIIVVVPRFRLESIKLEPFSSCHVQAFNMLLRDLGLKMGVEVACNEPNDVSVCGYEWSRDAEDAAVQRERYMAHITKYLRGVIDLNEENSEELLEEGEDVDMDDEDLEGQRYSLKDTASHVTLLSFDHPPIAKTFVGGPDALIIDRRPRDSRTNLLEGLHFVIELKKQIVRRRLKTFQRQVLLELIGADLKGVGRCIPVALLTDLSKSWYFYWFTPEKKIDFMLFQPPANAFKFIGHILTNETVPTRSGICNLLSPFVSSSSIPQRQRLALLALVPHTRLRTSST